MTLGAALDERTPLLPAKAYASEDLQLDTVRSPNVNKGVSVVWKNLTVTAHIEKQYLFKSTEHIYKELIHNVSGCVRPGTLVAIMGASGSGKSTLMSVLANRSPGGLKVRGTIRVNGKKIQMKYMREVSGFVYQDDMFMPALTVLEHLHFAAQLKLDRKISYDYRRQLINDILQDVGLLKCANSYISNSRYGRSQQCLSGGEQKRLSVATELITNPPLLFCDEPTTGLDSFSASKLITVMKNMTTQRNKTIVCSIHQPNEQIFDLFKHVILLRQGEIAFSGTAADALVFFKNLGFPHKPRQNPAEYFVKSLAITPGQEHQSNQKTADICNKFKESEYATEMYEYIEQECKKSTQEHFIPTKIERISWLRMLYLMTYRGLLVNKRDFSVQGIKTVNKQVLALIIGISLMGTVTLTQEGVQSLKGALFSLVAENFFPAVYTQLEYLPSQKPRFLREYANNINTPLVFYISVQLSMLPGHIFDPIVFATIIYWLTGLAADMTKYLITICINVLVLLTSVAFGNLMSMVAGSYNMSTVLTTGLDAIFLTLSGVFINMRTIPFVLWWVRYISWMAYAIEALMIVHIADADEIACSSNPELPCLRNGTEVLQQFDYNANNLWSNIISIILIWFTLHVACFLVFKLRLYYRTKNT